MGISPESFRPYGRLSQQDEPAKSRPKPDRSKPTRLVEPEIQDTAPAGDFEFRLEDPVTMLPADELFSNGKLLPLQFSSLKRQQPPLSDTRFLESDKFCPTTETDPYLFSPRAPRCSGRWRELLGLKKSSQNPKPETGGAKSLKHFLHKTTKSSSSSSLNLPPLKDSDSESVSMSSSRLSLSSSSSSGHEHEDLPRLSLDSDKPSPNPFAPCRNINQNPKAPRNGRRDSSASGGVSVDSPRMNSSGRIVFQSLERSSSSPSSFNGGPKFNQRGLMERSYSGNVRITPVLNVPVCSLRGSSKPGSVFGLFSSSQQKTANGGSSNSKGRQCHGSSSRRNRS